MGCGASTEEQGPEAHQVAYEKAQEECLASPPTSILRKGSALDYNRMRTAKDRRRSSYLLVQRQDGDSSTGSGERQRKSPTSDGGVGSPSSPLKTTQDDNGDPLQHTEVASSKGTASPITATNGTSDEADNPIGEEQPPPTIVHPKKKGIQFSADVVGGLEEHHKTFSKEKALGLSKKIK